MSILFYFPYIYEDPMSHWLLPSLLRQRIVNYSHLYVVSLLLILTECFPFGSVLERLLGPFKILKLFLMI